MRLTRRELIRLGAGGLLGGCALGGLGRLAAARRPRPAGAPEEADWARRARYYRRLEKGRVHCLLCPRECEVGPAERGFCGVRENRSGEYYTLVYGRAASVNVDPIEKKPFFHVKPGSPIFSFATAGCNLACKNCQNWQLSQARPEQIPAVDLAPAEVVAEARRQGCDLIAGTYNEPTVFAEYMLATAAEGNKHRVRSTMISAGYINRQPLADLCKELTAIKIDLKSMRDAFYRSNCAGGLKPVLNGLEVIRKEKVWLEIVYLVIPTLNDSDQEIRDLGRWIKGHLGPDVPLHFSRFYPQYRLKNLPQTPYETMSRCHQLARAEGLHYVYVGNVPGHAAESTYCPGCGKLLIRRQGFRVGEIHLKDGRCQYCRRQIPGIWA